MEGVGIAVLAFLLCCLNLVLWLFFLRKFNRFFSTDKIIQNTKTEVDNIIRDLNRATERDMTIIDARLQEIKAASAEAERHILVAKNELDRQTRLSQYQTALSSQNKNSKNDEFAATVKKTEQRRQEGSKSFGNISDGLFSANSYSITKEGQLALNGGQQELFEQQSEEPYINSPSGTKFSVDTQGNGFASIPKISPNIHFADEPLKPQKSINQQIKELSDKGYSIEMIARELNLTTTEVQFSLDMEV